MATDQTLPTRISRSAEMNENTEDYSENQTVSKMAPNMSCSLKRKRPPKIQIPNVLREIHTEHKDCTAQDESFCFGGFGVGVSSVKGKKKFMEDTHKIVSSSHGNKGFFGVYDGHGGCKAAEFVADNLHENILEMLKNCSGKMAKEEAVKAGFLKTDQEFLKQGLNSGVCCITALIEENEIIISNLGDCRAVLCRGGLAEALTKDHRAAQEDERKRIVEKGGYVEIYHGAWRVHGILSVSRSIGDAHLKDWVLAEPDTKILSLTHDMEYLVLASDGLWEEVGNQEAVDIVMRSCLVEKKLKSPGAIEEESGLSFICTSPSPKQRRVSLVKQNRKINRSPSFKRTVDSWKESEDAFGSENGSPPSKARRISLINQTKTKARSPDQENGCAKNRPLVAASKELLNVAVSRGSKDDITVMIIDLKYFK